MNFIEEIIMYRINRFILIVLVVAITASCSDNFLSPEPKSFLSPENIFTDETGLKSLVYTMSKDIKSEAMSFNSPLVTEYAASDLAVPGPQNNRTVKNFTSNLLPSGDGGVMNYPNKLFNIAYTAIRNTNTLVTRVDRIEWDNEETRNELLAEAYFYRSYWYYRLVHSYGDVPFIGEEIGGPKLDFKTHSRWAILDKIQEDMEWAVDWLPEAADPGQATRGAGNHLLAKISLANLDFDNAVTAATRVIDGPYALMEERFGIDADDPTKNVFWDLHRPENINNSQNTETIYSVIDRFEDPNGAKNGNGNLLPRAYNPAWWHSRVRDSEGQQGTIADGPQYERYFRGNGYARPTPYYLYEIWDFDNDLRRSDENWVEWDEIVYNNPASVDFGEPIDRANFAVPVDTFQHSYSFPHYKTFIPEQDPAAAPFGGNGDAYIFRLAETYLLRAEAHFWNGNLSLAADDINRVRQRAGTLPVSSVDMDIALIFDERARELFVEAPRHSELVRASYIMASNNINGYSLDNFSENNWFYDRVMEKNVFFQINLTWGAQSYRLSPHNVLWPIPETAITENTMGVINQNDGYPGTENNEPPIETIE